MTARQKYLPDLPKGWRNGRLLEMAETRTSNIDKHSTDGQKAVRLCNYVDVYYNETINKSINYMRASATDVQIDRFRLCLGDTLITKDSESADDIGIPAFVDYESDDLVCGYHLAIVRPRRHLVEPKYLFWVMRSAPTLLQWSVRATGVTRVGIKARDLARAIIPIPPMDEQRSIAGYLDRETQKIDELIAEQRGLIETVRERRRAIIDDQSLRGMDPLGSQRNVSWPSAAIGYGFEVKLGKMLDSGKVRDEMARDLPYIRAANIQDSGLDLGDLNSMPFTREEEVKFNIKCNDLLVVEGGAIGTSVVLEEDLPGVCFQKTVNRLRGTKDWNPRYYRYVLLAYRERGILDILANKSTIAHFTAEKLRGLRVPVPSIREQNEIAADLDHATSRTDELIAESEELIALSEERRAALITAAVTGQIDVRTTA